MQTQTWSVIQVSRDLSEDHMIYSKDDHTREDEDKASNASIEMNKLRWGLFSLINDFTSNQGSEYKLKEII